MSHEEIYNNFKEALFNATSADHLEEILELKLGCKVMLKSDVCIGKLNNIKRRC